jgi:hypothetical protein
VKCPACSSDIPDESRFCLKCGKDLAPPAQLPNDDGSEMFAMMAMGIAFMMFFFSMAPFFLGIWIAGVAMIGAGIVLMLAGYYMIRSSRRDHVAVIQHKAVRIRCRYCGTLNMERAERCSSCGASL